MPSASSWRATVDFPDPAGPHMKMTRGMALTVGGSLIGTHREGSEPSSGHLLLEASGEEERGLEGVLDESGIGGARAVSVGVVAPERRQELRRTVHGTLLALPGQVL